jgi:putative DNA methylase
MKRHLVAKAIEKDFPFEELNIVAELESWRKEVNRPMYHIHKWWAQRLGSVFRAIVLSGLTEDAGLVWNRYYEGYDSPKSIILDPFMGSGTTLGEALKFNCKVIGCDINPVSYFLVQKSLEDIPISSLKDAYCRLESSVRDKIQSYYRTVHDKSGENADILYTFWVMQAPCPSCGDPISLFNNYVFSTNAYPNRKPEAKAFCPNCEGVINTEYDSSEIKCPECEFCYNPRTGTARRSEFYCGHCNEWHPIQKTILASGKRPEYKMYGNMLWLESGLKVYAKPTEADHELYGKASKDLIENALPIPDDPIPPGHNTNQARGYNFLYWKELFNQRQLNSLSILLDGIRKEQDTSLREFMLILFSSCLEFNSMFCSFKGEGTGAVRHMFYHHILKPERLPLENTVWGFPKSSGAFSTLFKSRLLRAKEYQSSPFEIMPVASKGKFKGSKKFAGKSVNAKLADSFSGLIENAGNVLLFCGDSSRLDVPDKKIDAVITDPPYFDFVHYSELADYFYVWLKIGLQDYHPAFQNHNSRHKAEVQSTDKEVFRENLTSVYRECHRVLKDNGLMVFTFHHSRIDGWESIYRAVRDSGFSVVAAYPLKAEMSVATPKNQAKEPINLDSIIVCKKSNGRKVRDWAMLMEEIGSKSKEYVGRFNRSGKHLSRGDVKVIVTGESLVGLSAYVGAHKTVTDIQEDIMKVAEELFLAQKVTNSKTQCDARQKALF